MALLKSLIQRLLDSRTTPEEAGHSAMPSTAKTIFLSKDETVGSWGILNAGIAPDDGYLFVNVSAEDNTNSEVRAQLGNIFYVSAQAPAPKGLGVVIPVSKGASYSVEGAFVSHITVGFVKVTGGGCQTLKKLLLQGGGLCLKVWYSSLRRNSCRVGRNGWRSSQQFLFKALLSYLLFWMEKVTHSRCRTRGLSTSDVMEFGLPILEGSISSISDHLRMEIFRSGLTLKKVKNLPTQLGNQISSLLPIFEYTKSRGTLDPMFGGASC